MLIPTLHTCPEPKIRAWWPSLLRKCHLHQKKTLGFAVPNYEWFPSFEVCTSVCTCNGFKLILCNGLVSFQLLLQVVAVPVWLEVSFLHTQVLQCWMSHSTHTHTHTMHTHTHTMHTHTPVEQTHAHMHKDMHACTIVQKLCESRGGRPGLSVLMSLLVSVDVKIYWTVLRHWSQLVRNMSTDIWGH